MDAVETSRPPAVEGVQTSAGDRAVARAGAALSTLGGVVDAYAQRIRSAAFSAIAITGALVLPPMMVGMIDASTTRSPCMP